jgi:hypothetical protein
VRIEGLTFVEQNKNKTSHYARMATQGKKITWVVKCGEWYVDALSLFLVAPAGLLRLTAPSLRRGLIIDGEVVKM